MNERYSVSESANGGYDVVSTTDDGAKETVARCDFKPYAWKIAWCLNLVDDSFDAAYANLSTERRAEISAQPMVIKMPTVHWELP